MVISALASWAGKIRNSRPPDFVVKPREDESPYLNRWYVIPRNRFFNIYLHEFLRSDEDRALHDHPWFNLSVVLSGAYFEETIRKGGVHRWVLRRPGLFRRGIKFRSPWSAHRVELIAYTKAIEAPAYTLFITGPRLRRWGFHCPKGWRDWESFVSKTEDGNAIGPGCGELS